VAWTALATIAALTIAAAPLALRRLVVLGLRQRRAVLRYNFCAHRLAVVSGGQGALAALSAWPLAAFAPPLGFAPGG
jgi:hypothetical protein